LRIHDQSIKEEATPEVLMKCG